MAFQTRFNGNIDMIKPMQPGTHCSSRAKKNRLSKALMIILLLPLAAHAAQLQESGRSGKAIVERVCVECHGPGKQGAPQIGYRNAWEKRASQGLSGLTQHAIDGIRNMPAHGGSPDLTDLEIGRAVTHMVNQSGMHWIDPVEKSAKAVERTGQQIVEARCVVCHGTGQGGAPKIGDRAAWIPRLKNGLDATVRSAIRGYGGMAPRGGMADLTDIEVRNAIIYMINKDTATNR
jgi:cytochrome c5